MSDPKFTKESWKRTYTTIPHVVEGYDVSSDIVNVTIGDRNIPLAAWCMNSTAESAEYYHTMEANAALMVTAPEMYWMLEKCRTALRNCGMSCLSEDVFLLLKKARGEE